jgi:hypothetical protein
MARKKENSEWILSPGGKKIMKLVKMGIFFIKKKQNDLIINSINQE